MQYSFSSSYAGCYHNFIVTGLPEKRSIDPTLYSFTCVIKNILQRSKKTRPSDYLISKLGQLPKGDRKLLTFVDMNHSLPVWENTIKGADNGYNPAKDFFYNDQLWNKYFPNYPWVRQLFIPEADIAKILDDSGWKNQSVDFYLPAAKLVLEIDGLQHITDATQYSLDKRRVKALVNGDNTVIRIPVSVLKDENNALSSYAEKINEAIAKSELIASVIEHDYCSADSDLSQQYETVLRYQFAILLLIEHGAISFTEEIWHFSVPENDQSLFLIAWEDLFLWYKNLYILKGESISNPLIEFGHASEYIPVSVSLFDRPDETEYKGVTVLTDPWDGKDYYTVSCAELINYGLSNVPEKGTPQREALEFFLINLFHPKSIPEQTDAPFKPGQLSIIVNLLNLEKTIGILPTGGGKSLCYQLCAMLQPAITFVICPIISLLKDQKKNLDEAGIMRTDFVSSDIEPPVRIKRLSDFKRGKNQIFWISPERFQSRAFRDVLSTINETLQFGYAVIDEVHCLSEWGHDFRTSYLTLVDTITRFCPYAILVGLTATASQAVLNDLKVELQVAGSGIRSLPTLEREELTFIIKRTNNQNDELDQILREKGYGIKDHLPDSGIIFTLTKDQTNLVDPDDPSTKKNRLAGVLRAEFPENAEEIDVYSSKEPDKDNKQDNFLDGKTRLLSATKAFGMGVNKPDIRFTVHYNLPWSVESFYQEAGRAGRDGNKAESYILFSPDQFGSKSEIEKVFRRNITPAEIKKCKLKGDLSTIFYLWGLNNFGVDEDVAAIKEFGERLKNLSRQRDRLNKAYYSISADPVPFKTVPGNNTILLTNDRLELVLYRLKLLGFVDDWVIDWRGDDKNNTFEVYIADVSEETVKNHFLQYIRRYDPDFANPWKKEDEQYKRILLNKEEKYIYRYARALISWIYDHIIYSRRQAIKNIYDRCVDFSDKPPEEFKSSIDNYLKISEQTIVLDGIVREPSKYDLWFSIFDVSETDEEHRLKHRPMNSAEITALYDACSRYIESYRDITGLNLVYAITRAVTGKFESSYDQDLWDSCFSDIKLKYDKDKNTIIVQMLEILSRYLSGNNDLPVLDALSHMILKEFPKQDRAVYQYFHDNVSLAHILKDITTKITSALEKEYE